MNILEFLDKIEPLLLVVIPTIFGIWLKLKSEINKKKKDITEKEIQNAKEKYDMWQHEESRRIITKIKELCNVYRDKSDADSVMYFQLENGTIATSKLCNMFITCLAEDERYGEIQKRLSKLQRIPYSQLADWVTEVQSKILLYDNAIELPEGSVKDTLLGNLGSHIAAPVFDYDGYLIGMCAFNFKDINYNNASKESQVKLIEQFEASVETIFISYHIARKEKKRELGIDSPNM